MGCSVLSEVDADGFVSVQVDPYGEEQSGVASYEAHSPLGLYARPLDPEKDPTGAPIGKDACTVLYAHEGGQGHAWPLNDPRGIAKLPKGIKKKGGTVFFSPATGGYLAWEGVDPKKVRREGSLIGAVKYGDGKSMLVAFDVSKDGEEVIKITHGEGNGIEIRRDGSVFAVSKSGSTWMLIKDDQLVLNGDTQAQGSMSVGDAAAAQPVVSLPGLLTYLTALEAALKAPTGPYVVPPAAAMKDVLGCKTLTAS